MSKMLSAIIVFVLAAGIFFFYTKPAYTGPGTFERPSVNEMKAQIVQYEDALEKVAELEQVKQKLLSRYNSFNPQDIERLETLLPDHVDNIGLILELDGLASKYGMTLENVDVNSSAQGGGEQSGELGESIGIEGEKYDSLTLNFSTFGTYEKFKSFMQDLEASLRIVDLASLTFAAQETSSGGQPTYNFDISIRTYWLK
ncbi:MAG TPA: type 4a pilus biogenesis protein PilO [Candidatus Paceibacterota bacterium]